MAKRDSSPPLHSIADIATASWYAHRASTPPLKRPTPRIKLSPSIRPENTRNQTSAELGPGSDSESDSGSAAEPTSELASTVLAAALAPDVQSTAVASVGSQASSTATSGSDDDAHASTDISIYSDITAWQTALQSLPPTFKSADQHVHPLVRALVNQPTVRNVEWNQYRLAGSYKPRTPYDYSALLIYLSGQVNPNPCRNCLLKNGPFARCVVSPPAVLAVSTIKHACANCTYQNQHRRCVNEPIPESFKTRSDVTRSILKSKHAVPKKTAAKTSMMNSRVITGRMGNKLERDKKKERMQREGGMVRFLEALQMGQQEQNERERGLLQAHFIPPEQQERTEREMKELQEQVQKTQQFENRGSVRVVSPPAVASPGTKGESFDEKLRRVRALSPRSRRKMAAEVLQWQAAIATIEADEAVTAPDITVRGAEHGSRLGIALDNGTSSNSTPLSSTSLTGTGFANNARDGMGISDCGAEYIYDRMEEDVSDGNQEADYEEHVAGFSQP